jgi:hypothetical protein
MWFEARSRLLIIRFRFGYQVNRGSLLWGIRKVGDAYGKIEMGDGKGLQCP